MQFDDTITVNDEEFMLPTYLSDRYEGVEVVEDNEDQQPVINAPRPKLAPPGECMPMPEIDWS